MWEEDVAQETDKLEKQMEKVEQEDNIVHKKTVDQEELYENMSLQTGARHQTDEFNDRVEAYEQAMEQEQKQDEETVKRMEEEQEAQRVMAQGMTPDKMPSEMRHPNPSINIGEMYGGMKEDSFVQTRFEHEHDEDDVVPELTENVVNEQKAKVVDSRKTDFQGAKYDDYYDE
jgi:hypothetical protein